jgi:3',5'-cyclic AMP phosphodiesterase CpdA
VPRDQVVAFALYTHDAGVLKLTAQLFPLRPDDPREVRLEIASSGIWTEVARAPVLYPGWSAHFRLTGWDGDRDVDYRVRHGTAAVFSGVIRRDPTDKAEIVVATMSCNSSRTIGQRPEIVAGLMAQNPDLLFFAGDQTYRHTEHTAGWIEFGLQFRELMRDRPTICTPDDHDVGHGNLWGENGRRSTLPGNTDGGFFYPVEYVNMVQRQQTWHLPDPVDPVPVERGITVHFTRLRVGGLDFAILEDRKFKSGPAGKIPPLGPRPDHVNDSTYDPKSIDRPGLVLLGDRQLRFLRAWGQDWSGADMKAVLSQTAFCGAVHLHGADRDRLLADLDCNGWPQSGRNRALEEIRRVWGVHLCGDQHLGVVVRHGIETWGDGPYAFTNPALVNTIYGRWWHPADERAGPNAVAGSPLPWTGDYADGLGNKITMLAYANPVDIRDERQRADGYGLVRFNKATRRITFECWPRFPAVPGGPPAQFPGWPITIAQSDNDGRAVAGVLPELLFTGGSAPVVQVIEERSGDILYTVRVPGDRFQPRVYAPGRYTIKVGRDRPDGATLTGLEPAAPEAAGRRQIAL